VRSTPIGLAMLKDERPHVVAGNEEDNCAGAAPLGGPDPGTAGRHRRPSPELVVGAETVKGVRSAQQVGEQLRRAGCR
jgi:L-fucose/D-arabinose isomerase